MFLGGCPAPGLSPFWLPGGGPSPPGSCSDPTNLNPNTHLALYRQDFMFLPESLRHIKPSAVRRTGNAGNAGSGAPSNGGAVALQSLQNSFFSPDVIYPSVIPLPGTLPHGHTPDSPGPSSMDSKESPKSPAANPPSPTGDRKPFASSRPSSANSRPGELKFGIDRILTKQTDDIKEEQQTSKDDALCTDKTLLGSPTAGSLPPMMSPCPCAPTCAFFLSPYPGHGGHSSAAGSFISHPSGMPGYRTHDFPGPYALLTSPESTSPHHHHHHPHGTQQQPKRKRSWSRAVFSNLQRKGLEKRFEIQKYVTKPDRRQLAAMLGLTDAQVKVWFQNRRMKWRHQEEAKRKREEEDKKKVTDGSEDKSAQAQCLSKDDSQDCGMVIDEEESDIDVDDDEQFSIKARDGGDDSDNVEEFQGQHAGIAKPSSEYFFTANNNNNIDVKLKDTLLDVGIRENEPCSP